MCKQWQGVQVFEALKAGNILGIDLCSKKKSQVTITEANRLVEAWKDHDSGRGRFEEFTWSDYYRSATDKPFTEVHLSFDCAVPEMVEKALDVYRAPNQIMSSDQLVTLFQKIQVQFILYTDELKKKQEAYRRLETQHPERTVKTQLETKTNELETKTRQLETKTQEFEAVKQQLETKTKESSAVKQQLETKTQELADMNKQLQTANAKLRHQDEVLQKTKAEVLKLKGDLAKKELDVLALREEITQLKKNAPEELGKKPTLRHAIKDTSSEAGAAKELFSDSEVGSEVLSTESFDPEKLYLARSKTHGRAQSTTSFDPDNLYFSGSDESVSEADHKNRELSTREKVANCFRSVLLSGPPDNEETELLAAGKILLDQMQNGEPNDVLRDLRASCKTPTQNEQAQQ